MSEPPFVHLDLSMQHQIGPLNLNVAFQLTQPWSLLFAPSGAGKTTILRAIAGLLKPQQARILSRQMVIPNNAPSFVTEFILCDTASNIFVPTHRRVVRMVGQDSALFPHLSVIRNIRYHTGLLARDHDEKQQAEAYLRSIVNLCRVEHLTTKAPSQLSSGERQRVALARALAAPGCNLLLLDEPFTALDATLRDELIADLRVWLGRRNTPVLSVTHDIAEAFQLNAEVLKLHHDRITHQGPAAEVLAEERTRLLAQLSHPKVLSSPQSR